MRSVALIHLCVSFLKLIIVFRFPCLWLFVKKVDVMVQYFNVVVVFKSALSFLLLFYDAWTRCCGTPSDYPPGFLIKVVVSYCYGLLLGVLIAQWESCTAIEVDSLAPLPCS